MAKRHPGARSPEIVFALAKDLQAEIRVRIPEDQTYRGSVMELKSWMRRYFAIMRDEMVELNLPVVDFEVIALAIRDDYVKADLAQVSIRVRGLGHPETAARLEALRPAALAAAVDMVEQALAAEKGGKDGSSVKQ